MLIAHSETLIAFAIVGVVAGVVAPILERLGFGSVLSWLLAIGCGVGVVVGLVIRARSVERREANREHRQNPAGRDAGTEQDR